jgi:citrate synthase
MADDGVAGAKLLAEGKELFLKRIPATEGEDGFDISALLKETGDVTLDTGFVNTASCSSKITFINGDTGILRYRGYPIEQLAEHSNFLEVSYLLIYGELPTQEQADAFDARLRRHTLLHEDLKLFFNGFPRDAHPMPVLSSAVSALSTFYQDSLDPFDPEEVEISTIRLLAKLPTIAAYAYKKSMGQPFLYPDNSLSIPENFLRMTFGFPAEPYEVDPEMVKALDLLFILHADHEQNCSTSTVRMVGSRRSDLLLAGRRGHPRSTARCTAAPTRPCSRCSSEIGTSTEPLPKFIDKRQDKNSNQRLMGFGHRVYKNYDPRAKIIKKHRRRGVRGATGQEPAARHRLKLEEIALKDDYFVERKLYPNVDFYSGLIYQAMGFPTDMFTVLFAIGRLPGWIAQWREMIDDPRPRSAARARSTPAQPALHRHRGDGGRIAASAPD